MNSRGIAEDGANPIVSLDEEALLSAGLTRERAFAIDNMSIGLRVDEFAFNHLADAFYTRVYADKDTSFRRLFSANLETNVLNLADYLAQRTGGSTYYTIRQGVPDLTVKHSHFSIDERLAEKWLDHMENALHDCRVDFHDDEQTALLDFMRYQAYAIITFSRKSREFADRGSLF